MPETLEDFLMSQSPTAERPLLGQTVLIVEDSRFASEALRLIFQRSGARIRRADSLASAARHLRMYRPGVVMVDMGLPDGSGLDLIASLKTADPPIDCIIGMTGDDSFPKERALAVGADDFVLKPISSVIAFQKRLVSHLPRNARPIEVREVGEDTVAPDRMGLRDDLSLAADLLAPTPDNNVLDYLTGFLSGLARSAEDPELRHAVDDLAHVRDKGMEIVDTQVTLLRQMVTDRLNAEKSV